MHPRNLYILSCVWGDSSYKCFCSVYLINLLEIIKWFKRVSLRVLSGAGIDLQIELRYIYAWWLGKMNCWVVSKVFETSSFQSFLFEAGFTSRLAFFSYLEVWKRQLLWDTENWYCMQSKHFLNQRWINRFFYLDTHSWGDYSFCHLQKNLNFSPYLQQNALQLNESCEKLYQHVKHYTY